MVVASLVILFQPIQLTYSRLDKHCDHEDNNGTCKRGFCGLDILRDLESAVATGSSGNNTITKTESCGDLLRARKRVGPEVV